MWRCLVFVVAVSKWFLVAEAVPLGENTCQGVVKHPVKVKVNVTEPVTFRTYTWCLRVPPRCSKYIVQMRERVKEQIEMHNRTITVCCRGFVEMESKCVPACPPMTECPNMHCNRTNHCYCSPGYSGVFCNDPCPKGSWGRDCKKPCDCPDGFTCHHLTGDCMLDDKPSVKTTVRRAFTHISSESVPTTIRSVSISSTSGHLTTSRPVISILTQSTKTSAFPATIDYTIKNSLNPLVPTDREENFNPPVEHKLIPSIQNKPSTTSLHEFTTPPVITTEEPKITTIATPPTTKKPLITYITTPVPTTNNLEVTSQSVSHNSRLTTSHSTFPQLFTTSIKSTFKPTTHLDPSTVKLVIPYWREPTTIPVTPTIDPFAKLKDTLKSQDVENISSSELVTIPIYRNNQGHVSTQSFNVPVHLDVKTSTSSNQFNVNGRRFLNDPVTIGTLLNTSPTLKEVKYNFKELPSSMPSTSLPPPKAQDTPDPVFKINLKQTFFPDDFKYRDENTIPEFSTTLQTPYFSLPPKLHETFKTSPLNVGEAPLDFTTAPPFHLDVTNAPDSPLVPMQTPNRNWDLFIPSPGSTKSQGSLTIPFSPYIPITAGNFDHSTTEIPESSIIELKRLLVKPIVATDFSNNFEDKSFTLAEPKTSITHTFLHSFSDTIDMDSPEIQGTSSPTTLHVSHSVSRKKPYFIGGDFGLLSQVTNKKENVLSTTPFWSKFSNNFPKNDKTFKVKKLDGDIGSSEEPTFYPTTKFKATTSGIEFSNKAFDDLKNPEVIELNDKQGLLKSFSKSYLTPYEDEETHPTQRTSSFGLYYTLPEKDESSKPKSFELPINTNYQSVSEEPNIFESVNILNRNEFTSVLRPKVKSVVENLPSASIPIDFETGQEVSNKDSTVSNIILSTYNLFDKTVTPSVSANSPTNLLDDIEGYIENKSEKNQFLITNGKVLATTQLPPRDIHSSDNGNILEELSNYLPTNGDKSSSSINFKLESKMIPTQKYHATPPPQSGYLPTDKDFLNLTYILNSINDFTSNSKRGMKQSKSSLFENSLKVKHGETVSFLDFLANTAREHSTEIFKHVSTLPTQRNQKEEHIRNRSHHRKEKNNLSDSRIIHLNVTIPFSFYNPTTKFVQKNSTPNKSPTDNLSNSRELGKNTLPIDGRITTVSIISTSPIVKYQAKRSTKEYSEKTENAFNHITPNTFSSEPNIDSFQKLPQDPPVLQLSTVTPSYSGLIPTLPITPESRNEEVSKKPFRRKDTDLLFDHLEDVSLNMTAALAARASEVESSYLPTGVIATLASISGVGFLISAVIFAFIYCRKEKPVPMDSCIMAYEQPNNPDPSSIYSVPRPSLLPEIFFCPTFSHHYAAQINKELRELTYEGVKKVNSEPVYTEISSEITCV